MQCVDLGGRCVLYTGFRHFRLDQLYCSPEVEYPRKSLRRNPQEVHNANKTHRIRFSSFLAHAHNYIYFKDVLIFFNKFKLHDYVHMYMLTVVLFQRTGLLWKGGNYTN